MYDIITIGDSTIDTFLQIDDATLNCDVKTNECQLCFTYAEKIPITGAHQGVGGNAANVAVGAQKLGLRTAIVTEVGDDTNGLVIREDLAHLGVDTRYIKINKGKETRYSVVLNYKSERTILSYHAKRVYSPPALGSTRAIYYTSLGKTFERVQKNVILYKKRHPETILACNPGSYQCAEGVGHTKKLLPYINFLFVNKEEAQKLTKKSADIKELCSLLHHAGVETVIVTDGSRGSYVSENGIIHHMACFPVKTVSRTGAGDAYASGFMAAILKKHSIVEAMRWGSANASSVVQRFGGHTGLQNTIQISKIIKKYSSIEPKKLP